MVKYYSICPDLSHRTHRHHATPGSQSNWEFLSPPSGWVKTKTRFGENFRKCDRFSGDPFFFIPVVFWDFFWARRTRKSRCCLNMEWYLSILAKCRWAIRFGHWRGTLQYRLPFIQLGSADRVEFLTKMPFLVADSWRFNKSFARIRPEYPGPATGCELSGGHDLGFCKTWQNPIIWVVASQIYIFFSTLPGEMIQCDKYFSTGLKPPTRL